MKPHIFWFSELGEWVCMTEEPLEPIDSVGFGATPQEAYADWKRQTDSLNRIDADSTQA